MQDTVIKKDIIYMFFKNKKYWIPFVLICLSFYFFVMYGDITTTCGKSYELLDSIFMKSISSYHFESPFYIPIHVVFAIWNLPIFIMNKMSILGLDSMYSILWSKLLIIVSLIGILIEITSILEYYKVKKIEFWIFVFSTSFFVFIPVFNIYQYDSFGLFIFLNAVKRSLKEERLSSTTLLIMSISIIFKFFFAAFSFLIILLKEKRIISIFYKNFILFSPALLLVLVSVLLTNGGVASHDDISFFQMALSFVSIHTIKGPFYDYSFFIVFFILLSFYSYLLDASKYDTYVLWILSSFFLFWIMFGFYHPYWIIYCGCFIVLSLATTNSKTLLYVFLFFEILIVFQLSISFYWVLLSEGNLNYLFLKDINIHFLTKINYQNFAEFFISVMGENSNNVMVIISSISVALGIVLIYGTHPKHSLVDYVDDISRNIYKTIRLICLFMYMFLVFSIKLLI